MPCQQEEMMARGWRTDKSTIANAAAARTSRVKELVSELQERQRSASCPIPVSAPAKQDSTKLEAEPVFADVEFGVLNQTPSREFVRTVELFDTVFSSNRRIHVALLWPHIPPRAILPWMVREVSRGRRNPPLRTLFLNMSRPALQVLSGVEARTARLRARGVYRSGQENSALPIREIGADAHFYMFLGDTKESGISSVPLVSIVPHAVALNDGVYWRDFDEKTLKGFKQHFPLDRLRSIRKYLDVLTSLDRSPAFAFLLPPHFDRAARRAALSRLKAPIDLALIDMGTPALRGRDVSTLLQELLAELDKNQIVPTKILVTTDCPLRYSFIRQSVKNRRDPGVLGNRAERHRLVWASRERGFEVLPENQTASAPIVETIASQECIIATRLWNHSRALDDANPLRSVLVEGAAALKGMALTASGADAILAPYTDTHDFYHRVKRERHSFEPHYAKAMALIGESHGGRWREKIEADLAEALALANALRTDTPLMRYLKRVLTDASPDDDVLIVLRHPEDAQQANDFLLDFLTAPGRFSGRIPNMRVTTSSRYARELSIKKPTVVVWAASSNAGARAFIGDSFAPKQFRLVVAGQDAVTLTRLLAVVLDATEYQAYQERTALLKRALPWAPKDFGGIGAALGLDPDKPRKALPFVGHGFMLLDGYGQVAAGPGTQFYVLDPVSQQLHPREARSIEVGDAVFVMSDTIREEIEAVLREKDERGRTLEQALVDQYKAYVKAGIETLSKKEGKKIAASRIHEMLFEQNPDLPPIGKQAVDYWLQAADHLDVKTPYAASNPLHFEAFLKIMGAGIIARQLTDAVRVVRYALQREGHTNRALFDRLLLDPDSLILTGRVAFSKLQSLRDEAIENVFHVLEKNLENTASQMPEETAVQMVVQ
jgi:hypothetical protein